MTNNGGPLYVTNNGGPLMEVTLAFKWLILAASRLFAEMINQANDNDTNEALHYRVSVRGNTVAPFTNIVEL